MPADAPSRPAEPRDPRPFAVPARLPDVFHPLSPARVTLGGPLGQRVALNASRRLVEIDLEPLLAGFRRKPGSHPWIGEHIGKWMHAATLAWSNTGDPVLRERLDHAAGELIRAQEADGYLGTYPPGVRFGLQPGYDWDVWTHKYVILGLVTHHLYTGSAGALAAARRAADLLLRTFGPGKKSLLSAGEHAGMAATSVLEPMVLLHRVTGDSAYLDFALDIPRAWDEPGGPRLLSELTQTGTVSTIADAKAYEMLSNLVGLCELARATGDRRYLVPARNAWEDIVRNHLYITGTASSGERFRAPHVLPDEPSSDVGETCVTVTWIQLGWQLLRLTGDAKYADELERSYLNHLPAAQRPDGRAWCYFTPLEGEKAFRDGITCCQSSGPRGMALAPMQAYFTGTLGGAPFVAVTLFGASRADVTLGGHDVTIEQASGFPLSGGATLGFSLEGEATFAVLIRAPRWAQPLVVRGVPEAAISDLGFVVVPPRAYRRGDRLQIDFALGSRLVRGEFGNSGRAALQWGPVVLAYDEASNPAGPPFERVGLADGAKAALLGGEEATPITFAAPIRTAEGGPAEEQTAVFLPFADAGGSGGRFRVWVHAPESLGPAETPVKPIGGGQSSMEHEESDVETVRSCAVRAGELRRIYDPSAGEEGPWYINDHCFIRDEGGTWHLFGITHAEPMDPLGETNLAHATSPSLTGGPWQKHPFAMSADRDGWGENQLWAPHVVRCNGLYCMFVCVGGPSHEEYKIHLATSPDLWTWTRHPRNPMVVDGFDARDPNVVRIGDHWNMYYTATSEPEGGRHVVACRTSRDLITWSERRVVFTDTETGTFGGPTESPFVVRRGRSHYLFICNADRRGGYDSTDVYRSEDPHLFRMEDRVGTLGVHAAEVVRDVDGRWYVSHCGWGRGGVYLAPLWWEDGEDDDDTSLPAG